MANLKHLRVSLIWTEVFPDRLTSAANGSLLSEFESAHQFQAPFGDAVAQQNNLDLPWQRRREFESNYFWQYYLNKPALSTVTAAHAWRHIMPLQALPRATMTSQELGPTGRGMLSTYVYAQGIAAVATFDLRGDWPLADAVTKLIDIRRTADFEAKWSDQDLQVGRLNAVANAALNRLRERALGAGAAAGTRPSDPFTIVTVVAGDGFDASVAVPPNGDVHRALEGLCTWSPSWTANQLHEWSASTLPLKHSPVGHAAYALQRGRAVWFPYWFKPMNKAIHTLACYHNNLVAVSLQTETMSAIVGQLAAARAQGAGVTAQAGDVGRHAANALVRLFRGEQETYRSWSSRRQIADSGRVDAINQVRQHHGLAPLPT